MKTKQQLRHAAAMAAMYLEDEANRDENEQAERAREIVRERQDAADEGLTVEEFRKQWDAIARRRGRESFSVIGEGSY